MPEYRDIPNTARFLDELRSTEFRVKIPSAAMIPKVTNMLPPTTGSGMVERNAPSFPITDNIIKITPVATRHERLATLKRESETVK